MPMNIANIVSEFQHWLRLSILLYSGITEALLAVLHNSQNDTSYNGLPSDPATLYKELDTTHKHKLNKLKGKVIKQEQWEKLFPKGGLTDTKEFDITLIVILITNLTTLKQPQTGWDHRKLLPTDNSKEANVIKAREWRNYIIHHTNPKDIDEQHFRTKWTEGENIIRSLGYQFDSNQLKTISLDPKTSVWGRIIDVLKRYVDGENERRDEELCKVFQKFLQIQHNINQDQRIINQDQHNTNQDQRIINQDQHNINQDQRNTNQDQRNTNQDQHNINQYQHNINQDQHNINQKCQLRMDELERIVVNAPESRSLSQDHHMEDVEEKQKNVSDKRMKCIRSFPNGCIFEICFEEHACEVKSVHLLDEHQNKVIVPVKGDNKEGPCYTLKILSEQLLVKVENLENGCLSAVYINTTNELAYADNVNILNELQCNHILGVGSLVFISPPLGQLGDSQCCIGIQIDLNITESTELHIHLGCLTSIETVKEFSEEGLIYLKRNFPEFEKELLHFVPLWMIEDQTTRNVAECFTTLLQSAFGFRAIISHFNALKYFELARKDLQTKTGTYKNRLLVFVESNYCVLNIRVLKENTSDAMFEEMKHCVTDLKHLAAINKNTKCHFVSIGLVACPGMSRKTLNKMVKFYFPDSDTSLSELFFISQDDFTTDTLKTWWDNILSKELNKVVKSENCRENFNGEEFKLVVGQLMATIACVESNLPRFSPDAYLQITSLLLNKQQYEAIHSAEPNKLIFGPYGSGKSIVADAIVKKKYEEFLKTGKKCRLIYLVWDVYTLLEVYKQDFIDQLKAEQNGHENTQLVVLECGNLLRLTKNVDTDLLSFLGFALQGDYELVHAVIEEFSSEGVHHKDIEGIDTLLKNNEKLTISLIPQSIDMERKIDRARILQKKNCLRDIKSLEKCELKNVMRNTTGISSLIKHSQNLIQDAPNIVSVSHDFLPGTINGDKENRKSRNNEKETTSNLYRHSSKKQKLDGECKKRQESMKKSEKVTDLSRTDKTYRSESINRSENITQLGRMHQTENIKQPNRIRQLDKMIQPKNINRPRSANNVNNQAMSNPVIANQNQERRSSVIVDLDKASKLLQESSSECPNIVEMETKFVFHDVYSGHRIKGEKPVLIKLHDTFDDLSFENSTFVLSQTLKCICLSNDVPTIISCGNIEEAKQLWCALRGLHRVSFECYFPQILGIHPSIDEKRLIIKRLSGDDEDGEHNRIVICDNSAVRGVEARKVIYLVRSSEKFLRHLFIEVVSRASLQVFIIELPMKKAITTVPSTTTAVAQPKITTAASAMQPSATAAQPTTKLIVGDKTCLKYVLDDLVQKDFFVIKDVSWQNDLTSFDSVRKHGNKLDINLSVMERNGSLEVDVNLFNEKFQVQTASQDIIRISKKTIERRLTKSEINEIQPKRRSVFEKYADSLVEKQLDSSINEESVRKLWLEHLDDLPTFTFLLTPQHVFPHPKMHWRGDYKWELIEPDSNYWRHFPDFIFLTTTRQRVTFTVIELKVCHYHKETECYRYCTSKMRNLKKGEVLYDDTELNFNIIEAKDTSMWLQDAADQTLKSKNCLKYILKSGYILKDQAFEGIKINLQSYAVVAVIDPELKYVRQFDWTSVVQKQKKD